MGTVSISLIQFLEAGRSKSNDFHMCLITQPRFGELELCCSFQTSLNVSGLNPLPEWWLSYNRLNIQYAILFHNDWHNDAKNTGNYCQEVRQI